VKGLTQQRPGQDGDEQYKRIMGLNSHPDADHQREEPDDRSNRRL
jgi:hypothetical protein